MNYKLLLFFLLACTICEGQSSVLTTPIESIQSVSDSNPSPTNGDAPNSSQSSRQVGERTYIGSPVPAGSGVPGPSPAQTRLVGPLTTKSEFERFAEDATGRKLPVYGRRLFDEVPTTFAPVERVPVPAGYVLGPGDELLIRAWGKIDLDSRVTVDRNGQVFLPRVGTLTVAGLRYDQLGGYLHSAVSALFKDFELNVALGQLRSIQIFVLGSARQPGAYTVGSLSTLVDALFACGGPSATGTMRHIQLRRDGNLLTEFDIYDLIQKGDKSHDVQLLPGDVIYVPPIGAQVAITGSVNGPGIYELKGETTLAAAIESAGGLTNLAGTERALLERIDHHGSRRVEEFPLDTQRLRSVLADGDLLRIYPISPKFENAVTLRGNVAQPGRYVWKEGMRVSDLIPSRDFLVTRDFWNGQNELVRGSVDHEFSTQGAEALNGRHSGQVRNPRAGPIMDQRSDQNPEQRFNQNPDQSFDQSTAQRSNQSPDQRSNQNPDQSFDQSTDQRFDQNANQRSDQIGKATTGQLGASPGSIIDSIGQNSAEINWEYAVIERLDSQDLSTRLIPFRLASAMDDPASRDNQLLRPGDVVTIFSRADLELPVEKHSSFIRVSGEVNAPGVYRINAGETLRDVVKQAGGLTPHSYLYASLLTRVSTKRAEEQQLRQSTGQMQRELSSRYANSTPQPGQTGGDQQAQLAMQQASLASLSSIKPTGRVVLDMKPDAATAVDLPDFPLEDGDTFYVPPRLGTIQVFGAVYNANAFRHEPEKRLLSYLNDAGGATREADKKRIFVIRADGTVVSRQSSSSHSHGNFEKLMLLPGDAIVVPQKLQISSKLSDLLQATQFASQTAVTAAALSVIK